MSDNLVGGRVRAIRGGIGELKADMQKVKERLGLLEAQYCLISRRVDRVGGDIGRIEIRLNLQRL